jgi:hypothetical protein
MARSDIRKLEDYITRNLEKGHPFKRIYRELVKVGHSHDAISEAKKNVFASKPHLRRHPAFFKVLTLYSLSLIALALLLFVASKVGEQMQYERTVQQFERNQTYILLQDDELLIRAKIWGDLTACDYIANDVLKYICFNKVWLQPNCQFEIFSGLNESVCFQSKSVEFKDVGLCDLEFSENARRACVENFVQRLFVEKSGDISLCGADSYCWSFAVVKKGDLSLCEKSEDPYACLFVSSDLAADPAICDTVTKEFKCDLPVRRENFDSEESYDVCMKKAACLGRSVEGERMLRRSHCGPSDISSFDDVLDQLYESTGKNVTSSNPLLQKNFKRGALCVIDFAKESKDPSFCSFIPSVTVEEKNFFSRCLIDTAKAKGDVSVCDFLSGSWKTLCVAVFTGDLSVCSGISSELDAGRCRFWVVNGFDENCKFDPLLNRYDDDCVGLKLAKTQIYSEEFAFGR